jgi:cellulose synthase/poly-beta-1,6-N-acetylglucosamine synthase-like glycosyltransferase
MDLITSVSHGFAAVGIAVGALHVALILWPARAPPPGEPPATLTVVVPARNEAAGIGDCLRSLQAAAFVGTRTIVVVDDGSDDDTARIAEGFGVTVIRTAHLGKARAINAALRVSQGELVAVVDADSVIAPDALVEAAARFTAPEVAAVCATVKVRNRRALLGMWLHIEQLFNSVLRAAFVKVNATIVTPGPLSVYRRAALDRVGGFSPDGYSEDVDIALRLIAAGYRVDAAPRAISETTMPVSARGFVRQRLRFTRGWIHVFRAHLRPGRTAATLLALPLALYGFVQSVVMSALMTSALAGAYAQEVARHGSLVSPAPLFVLYRLSLYGLVSWIHAVATHPHALTPWVAAQLVASVLPYPIYLYAIARFDRRIDVWHVIPLLFMFPFWLAVMLLHIAAVPAVWAAVPRNRWTK